VKEKPSMPRGLRHSISFVLFLLFLGGIFLTFYAFVSSKNEVYAEFDRHLYDIASSVDHNISIELDRCRLEMAATVTSVPVEEALASYVFSGNLEPIQTLLVQSVRWNKEFNGRILFKHGDKILASSDPDDSFRYTVLDEQEDDVISLYLDDETNQAFLAIEHTTRYSNISYVMLIEAESFYRRIVASSMYSDYWIVLFEKGGGLVLHNDMEQPTAVFYSEDEIRARSDGLSVLLSSQENNQLETESYSFTHVDGVEHSSRISVIPSGRTDNQALTVAVSAYDSALVQPIQLRFFVMLMSAVLIAFSSAAAAFLLMHNGKKAREMAEELASLEKEYELSSMLLKHQSELSHHQKLETIGTLTAGVAHEFNNLLSPIMSDSLLILENTPPENTAVYDNAIEIYEASQRAKTLVSRISMLSRHSSAEQMRQIEPRALAESVLNMVAATIPKNVTVEKTFQTNARVFGNESQLVHMLLNLVINAIQAMSPQGGTLTIFVWDDSRSVFFSVADTGKGVPEALLPMLFEPFFTTKESGKGTGLGLSIAQRTAVNHGGSIAVENLPDGGAMFTVHLPIYRDY